MELKNKKQRLNEGFSLVPAANPRPWVYLLTTPLPFGMFRKVSSNSVKVQLV